MMNRFRCPGTIAAILLVAHGTLFAQLPTPELNRMNPPAARAGEMLRVALYGSNLDDLSQLRFTHDGITARRVTKPPAEFFTEPQPVGSSFDVTVGKDVPPGIYEARAVTQLGISTARAFLVAPADSIEIREEGDHSTRDKAMPVQVNSVINGDAPSRGIDWYRFTAKANQRVLLELHAERIDSRMDGQLIVYNADGREVSRNRDWFGRDSFLEVSGTEAAEYFVAVSDILYRGGSEHFYRLSISTRPHIDFIDPPAGEPGSTKTYTLYGRNLPGGKLSDSVSINGKRLELVEVEITLPATVATPTSFHAGQPRQGLLRGFDYQYRGSNAVRIGFATAPVVAEEPAKQVQQITIPSEVAARFDQANDEDVFRFTAKKGQTVAVECIADRMASAVDVLLVLEKVSTAGDGTETLTMVTEADDPVSLFRADNRDSINPDTNDPAIVFTADQDGVYQVTVVNQFGNGGPAEQYRLAIREPLPDFELLAAFERPLPTGRTGYSSTPTLRQGATAGLRIVAPRQDGFEGDIVITAEDLPPGVTSSPLILSGKTDRGILVVSAATNAKSWTGDIRIVGRAIVGNRKLVREARFASLVWGHIFADSIRVRSRLTQRVPLGVVGDEQACVQLQVAEQKAWSVEVGQKLELPVKLVDNGTRVGPLTVEVHHLYGMKRGYPSVNIAQDVTEDTLTIEFKKNGNFDVEPGRYQFVVHGTGVMKYRRNPGAVTKTEAEIERFKQLITQLNEKAKIAQAELDAARVSLQKARKDSAAPPAKNKATPQQLRTAEATLKSAEAKARDTAARVKRAEAAARTLERALKSASNTATERSKSFAVWSDQVTVNVLPIKK